MLLRVVHVILINVAVYFSRRSPFLRKEATNQYLIAGFFNDTHLGAVLFVPHVLSLMHLVSYEPCKKMSVFYCISGCACKTKCVWQLYVPMLFRSASGLINMYYFQQKVFLIKRNKILQHYKYLRFNLNAFSPNVPYQIGSVCERKQISSTQRHERVMQPRLKHCV